MRLELTLIQLFLYLVVYFNSIKVRLELDKLLRLQQQAGKFQFHKGAIRTRKVLGVDVLRIYGFVGAKIQKNLQKNVDA